MDHSGEGLLKAQKLAFRMLTQKTHPQQSLLSAMNFASYARKRGLRVSSSQLENYEKQGLLYPVLYCRASTANYRVIERHEDGRIEYEREPLERDPCAGEDIIEIPGSFWYSAELLNAIGEAAEVVGEESPVMWPGQTQFVPWREQRDGITYMPTVWRYYHPYQVFRLRSVLQSTTHAIRLSPDPSEAILERVKDLFQHEAVSRAENLRLNHAASFRELAVLIAIEDLYLPLVRENLRDYDFGNQRMRWDDWQRKVSRESILEATGYSISELIELRKGIAIRGTLLDPNRDFYMLFRNMPFRQREKLRGEARVAWEYYETAEILGLFLHDLTGESQPQVDDLWGGGEFKERLYGIPAQEIDYRTGNVLPALTRRLGIDVRPRVLWLAEGKTEVAFIEGYCQALGIDMQSQGVECDHISGINHAKDPILISRLKQAIKSGTAIVVTIDDEVGADDIERLLRQLSGSNMRRYLADLDTEAAVFGVYVWPSNFENENFTTEQLFDAWFASVVEYLVEEDCPIRPDELRTEFQDYTKTVSDSQPLQMVQGFANSKHLHYCKPDVGRELGDLVAKDRIESADASFAPIEKLIHGVIQTAQHLRTGKFLYE